MKATKQQKPVARDRSRSQAWRRGQENRPAIHLWRPLEGGKAADRTAADLLGSSPLAAAQREDVAAEVRRAQGNRYLNRVVVSAVHTAPAGLTPAATIQRERGPETMQARSDERTARTPLLENIRNRLDAEKYLSDEPGIPDPISQNPALCRVLLILFARMGSLWELVPPGSIDWVDEQGVIDFVPTNMNAFRAVLESQGYTPSYWAKARDNLWGLREPNIPAAGLHIRGKSDGKANVHIDLHPPSWTGFWHWFMDSFTRGRTHTPETLQAGVESLGAYIPVLYEQRMHGELTALLNGLMAKARGHPEAQAEIEEGLDYLRQAGALLWNKPGISQEELSEASWLLGLAGASASGAASSLARTG